MGVRPHPLDYGRWWDATWNTTAGCSVVSAGCLNCYAALAAGTLQTSTETALYLGTTKKRGDRYIYNGVLTALPPAHPSWTFPLDWKGAAEPLLGPGPQTLIRDMKPSWARAVRDQCAAADIAFFMKQMSGKRPLPPDLLIRKFPRR
jgi:protein gp37